MKKAWLPVLLIILVIGIFTMVVYNGLVAKDEAVNKSFAELQATYQRRLDLLPNLVSAVKANSEYEKTVLKEVTEARAMAAQVTSTVLPQADGIEKLETTQNQLAVAANRLVAVIENYPNLRATDAFSKLQAQIEGTERRIKVARNDLNSSVQGYNQSVRKVPANLVAGMLGFKVKEGFQADAGASQPPEIKF